MNLQQLRASREHWSYSALNQYANICSLQYYFERVAKLPRERVSSNMIFGSAIHAALDELARQRQGGHEDVAAAVTVFDTRLAAELAGPTPIEFANGQTAESLAAQGKALIEHFAAEWKDEEIVAVGREFVVPLADEQGVLDKPLMGEFDVLIRDKKGRLVVVDWKTAARRKSDDDVAGDLQATVYAYAIKQLFDERPAFRFDVLLKTKQPAVERYVTARDDRDFRRLVAIARQVQRGVAAGVHIPADKSFYCSGCSFRKACSRWPSNGATQ